MFLQNKKQTPKVVTKKGIDLKAQSRNTQDLRTDLANRYPGLIKAEPASDDDDSMSSELPDGKGLLTIAYCESLSCLNVWYSHIIWCCFR